MINQLLCLATFERIISVVIYCAIGIAICIGLAILLKSEGGKKVVFYIITGAIIIGGLVCGIQLYKEVTSKSYINGQIDIQNQFVTQSFEYKSSSVTLAKVGDSNIYTFEIDLTKVEDFNGVEKQYEVKMNDYILFNAVITSGSVSAEIEVDFYDTNNNKICTSELKILVEFLSNKTKLKLSTEGAEQAEFLMQYFSDYGFRLNIAELKGDLR